MRLSEADDRHRFELGACRRFICRRPVFCRGTQNMSNINRRLVLEDTFSLCGTRSAHPARSVTAGVGAGGQQAFRFPTGDVGTQVARIRVGIFH